MIDELEQFLSGLSLKNSERKARQMVAEHFGGKTTSHCRYVKIGESEFRIEKDADSLTGWTIKKMEWRHGNDWKYSKPY